MTPGEQWVAIGIAGAGALWWYVATEDNRRCAMEADAAGHVALAALSGRLDESTITIGKQDYGLSEDIMRQYVPHVANLKPVQDGTVRTIMASEYALRIKDACLGQ